MASAEPKVSIEQPHVTIAPQQVVTGLNCLITSSSEARGQALSWAAADAGWRTTICRDAPTARAYWERMLAQLAIIDLETAQAEDAEELKALVEFLARQGGLLLLLCGQDGCAAEEIWARQLGVWLYLPGAAAGGELTAVCQEARDLAKRLEPAPPAPVTPFATPAATRQQPR